MEPSSWETSLQTPLCIGAELRQCMGWQPGMCCSVLHGQGVISTVSVRAPQTFISSDPVLVNAPVLQ